MLARDLWINRERDGGHQNAKAINLGFVDPAEVRFMNGSGIEMVKSKQSEAAY